MSYQTDLRGAENWRCGKCGVALEPSKVEVSYMGSNYPVDLPKCPSCGIVYVPEQLAMGKMADVEKILEDK